MYEVPKEHAVSYKLMSPPDASIYAPQPDCLKLWNVQEKMRQFFTTTQKAME